LRLGVRKNLGATLPLYTAGRAGALVGLRTECAQSSPDVIVVCAPENEESYRYRPAGPPPPTAMEEIGDKLRLKAGPVEGDIVQMPALHGKASIGVRARIRF
jgi:hypothetical protein